MKRFKNLLVVAADLAGTRLLLERAVELAERNTADVILFDVLNPVPNRRRFLNIGSREVDVQEVLRDDRLQALQELADSISSEVSVEVANGTPFVEIIRRVEEHDHDLVMLPADSMGQRRNLAGAPTAMHLLRKCPVPVWVDTGHDNNPAVAVGVGPFDVDRGAGTLDLTLLQLASSLAAMRGGELEVVHAWRLEGESLLRGPRMSTTPQEVDAMVEAVRRDAESSVRDLLDQVDVQTPVRIHLGKGTAGEVIPAFVEDNDPGVLVLGTVARTDIRGMIIGNTAERVLGSVSTSILAVKPQGFVSPIS